MHHKPSDFDTACCHFVSDANILQHSVPGEKGNVAMLPKVYMSDLYEIHTCFSSDSKR